MYEIFTVTLIALLAGVVGTASGAFITIFLKNPRKKLVGFVLGFAGGIMLAIVMTDLLPEAIETSNFITAVMGLLIGVALILFLDENLPHFHFFETKQEFSQFIRAGAVLGLGIAMHNLPEGIAIGAGYIASPALGFTLTFTIALHNIPEGMAMASPLCVGGLKMMRIFFYTGLAGIPMGIGALIGASISNVSPLILSVALSFAGGAMLYIIFSELIPGAQKAAPGQAGTMGTILGTIVGIFILSIV